MPICNAEELSIPAHSKYWENCTCDRRYKAYYRFNQNQLYEGEFFRDSLHGQGAYTWKNAAVYEGGFYSNSKEGYASLSFADNSYFEGLFVKNQPFGPGILTYANGRQDAGFWMGKKLIRLSRAVDYIIPRLAPNPAAKIKLLQFKHFLPLNEQFYDPAADVMEKLGCQPVQFAKYFSSLYSSVIYDPRSIFFDKQIFDKTFFINEVTDEFIKDSKDLENGIIEGVEFNGEEEDSNNLEEERVPSHCLCQQDVFEMNYENVDEVDACDGESYKGELEMGILGYFTKFEGLEENEEVEESQLFQKNDEEEKDESKCPKILLWNRSELCKEILKQMFKYRGFEEELNFNLAKLMLGARTTFRKTGEKEKQCLQLLKMCSLGPPHAVKDLLCSYEISQDLMDGRGNNSLMFAAATDQHEIMDILLDYGVDVDNFNDEGLTPLNLCLLRRLALTNNIYNWETAFLPQEVDKSTSQIDTPKEEFQSFQSITSLDRIFGDGMSVYDSKTLIHDNHFLALLPTEAPYFQESFHGVSIKTESVCDDLEANNFSRVSIFELLKSAKNYSLAKVNGDKDQMNSFCSLRTINPSQGIESNESTLKINVKYVPKHIKRDEFERSIQKVSTDRYLFEFNFKENPSVGGNKKEKEGTPKSSKTKTSRVQEKGNEEKKEEESKNPEEMDLECNRKLAEIDKTIEKLLKRGADPNKSEVPKPSIHLGVHTKDLKMICMLLTYGANPNCQLYANEGLLTPLHVIVLQEPDQKNVQICEMLLHYGADTELETSPEFCLSEKERNLLDSNCGRTPLQLLCMRPDLQYADPQDNLIKIGLLLANVSNKRHFYNGHSCLTLAMLSGNLKILKALLEAKYFDPNDILGNDRGTALHVLVSTELQKITAYENSIKMCDLLIAKGADPLKKFKHPEKLLGTCVDYGYREIEAEKEARKATSSEKKDPKIGKGKEKAAVGDYLKDHERVVEYLGKIASNMAKNKETEIDVKKNRKTQNRDMEDESEKGGKNAREQENKGMEAPPIDSRETKEISSASKTENKEKPDLEKTKKNFPEKLKAEEEKAYEPKVENVRTSLENKELKSKKKNQEDIDRNRKNSKPPERKQNGKSKKADKEKTRTQSDKANIKSYKVNQKAVCPRSQGSHLETFPEKLRQVFLQLYGSRFDIDVNELLVPYVVLRNGELYYRFHKKGSTCPKEQYSLI